MGARGTLPPRSLSAAVVQAPTPASAALASATSSARPSPQAIAPSTAVRLGEHAYLTLCTRDRLGNQQLRGGERVELSVLPPPREPAAVRDNGDGTYTLRFTPSAVGESVVRVKVGGVQIGGAPYLVVVLAGAASAAQSSAFGKALVGVLVNEVASFVVQARDVSGNALRAGGDVVDVLIAAGSARVVDLSDQGNGSYHCALIAFEPGSLELHVRMNGLPISGSPFTVRVLGYELRQPGCEAALGGSGAAVASPMSSMPVVGAEAGWFGGGVSASSGSPRSPVRAVRASAHGRSASGHPDDEYHHR